MVTAVPILEIGAVLLAAAAGISAVAARMPVRGWRPEAAVAAS